MSASGTKYGQKYGQTARMLLWALAGLLVLGVAGSLMMSVRARNDAQKQIVEQAQTIVERSLTLAFEPEDLEAPADVERAAILTQHVTEVVLDPSDFTTVTLYGADGTILYSTEAGRIGNQLVGEQERIREALKGIVQNRSSDGRFSTLSAFRFPSGVGRPSAVELVRDDAPIANAAAPWRAIALFLFVILVLVGLVAWGLNKIALAAALAAASASSEQRQHAAPTQAAAPTQKPITVLQPGLREEGEARRQSDERAKAAEERAALLQEQYRKTLEELQGYQRLAREPQRGDQALSDPAIEERALRAEGQVHTLQQQLQTLATERQQLERRLREVETAGGTTADPAGSAVRDGELRDAHQESIGLRAELEGAQTQLEVLRREVETLRTGASAVDQEGSGPDRSATHAELARTKDALSTTESQLRSAHRELEDARGELRSLRTEEQRAAMLEGELRTARAAAGSLEASHRAELVEREAEFEEKVRATREAFQRQLTEIEATYKAQLGKREADLAGRIAEAETAARQAAREVETMASEREAARAEAISREQRLIETTEGIEALRAEADALRAELADRRSAAETATSQAQLAGATAEELQAEIQRAHEAVAQLRGDLAAERAAAAEAVEVAERAEREAATLALQTAETARRFEEAVAENADLNRRLQEIESRRQLELAGDQGRAAIDELLRVTQERLAGQTEKLMTTEDRIRELESELTATMERIEVAETELRTHRMSEALKEMREGEHVEDGAAVGASDGGTISVGAHTEDRRASSPFTKELSLDAKKTIARMMGITQILKHKKDAKEQAQLIKQLTTYARRLDHTVSDLAETDTLARGELELKVKRTDLDALIQRVVEESGVDTDHDVRVATESVVIGVDPLRTEQIVSGLLRAAGDRTATGKEIVVRLGTADGGALISVEDPEPSSDASLSPVVKRFAEAQGGWAKVESRPDGGSAFRVFLPDGSPARDEVRVLVEGEQQADVWDNSAEDILVQELHRLAELPDNGNVKSTGRSRRAGRKG